MKGVMSGTPSGKVILRILGFTAGQVTERNAHRVVRDPIICERRSEALDKRSGGPSDRNIFCTYHRTPMREDEAHLNFPGNFDISDEACVLAIWNKMSEQERQELRERILNEPLQEAFGKVIHDDLLAMQAGDMTRNSFATMRAMIQSR
jgi:hypothetical protein